MISQRLLTVASFIKETDNIIDIGCDHGYLGIYLKENKKCHDLLLTDNKTSALNNAINNIKSSKLKIKTMLTDGLDNIDLTMYNTITISGMGASTILKILSPLKGQKNISKLIIQSNNDLPELRSNVQKLGYYLIDEKVVFEKNIWYVIGEYKLDYKKLTSKEKLFGIFKSQNKEYYAYLYHNYQKILELIPKNKIIVRLNIYYKILTIKSLLKKCR